MSYADTLAIALTNARRAATQRHYVFAEHGVNEACTIDMLVAAVREQDEVDGITPAQIDEHEMTLRMAALVVEGVLVQPENPAPGSVAEIHAPIVAWLRAAAQPWP